jgi:hypothetical protein
MPWWITVPAALAVAVVLGLAALAIWIRMHGPAVARQVALACDRERALQGRAREEAAPR